MSKRTDDPVLNVAMPRSGWISLIGALSALPYRQVADLIETIAAQGNSQLDALDALERKSDTGVPSARAN